MLFIMRPQLRLRMPRRRVEQQHILASVSVEVSNHGPLRGAVNPPWLARGDPVHVADGLEAALERSAEFDVGELSLSAGHEVDLVEALEDLHVDPLDPGTAQGDGDRGPGRLQLLRDEQGDREGRAHDGEPDQVRAAAPGEQGGRRAGQSLSCRKLAVTEAEREVLERHVVFG